MRPNLPSLVAAALLVAGGGTFHPAHATQNLVCDHSEEISISLLMGDLAIASVSRADITVNVKRWSTQAGPGVTTIVVGQAYQSESELRIDFTDENVNAFIARLRLVQASDETTLAQAGVLEMPGVGVWPVVCTEG